MAIEKLSFNSLENNKYNLISEKELEIFKIVLKKGPIKIRDVYEELNWEKFRGDNGRITPYVTIKFRMDRLISKKILKRKRKLNYHLYYVNNNLIDIKLLKKSFETH